MQLLLRFVHKVQKQFVLIGIAFLVIVLYLPAVVVQLLLKGIHHLRGPLAGHGIGNVSGADFSQLGNHAGLEQIPARIGPVLHRQGADLPVDLRQLRFADGKGVIIPQRERRRDLHPGGADNAALVILFQRERRGIVNLLRILHGGFRIGFPYQLRNHRLAEAPLAADGVQILLLVFLRILLCGLLKLLCGKLKNKTQMIGIYVFKRIGHEVLPFL